MSLSLWLLHVGEGAGRAAVKGDAGSQGGAGASHLPLELVHLRLGGHLVHLLLR